VETMPSKRNALVVFPKSFRAGVNWPLLLHKLRSAVEYGKYGPPFVWFAKGRSLAMPNYNSNGRSHDDFGSALNLH
jgi:hypothetical protein